MRCSAAQSIDVTKIKPQRLTRLVSQPTITGNSGGCARVRTRVVNGRPPRVTTNHQQSPSGSAAPGRLPRCKSPIPAPPCSFEQRWFVVSRDW